MFIDSVPKYLKIRFQQPLKKKEKSFNSGQTAIQREIEGGEDSGTEGERKR